MRWLLNIKQHPVRYWIGVAIMATLLLHVSGKVPLSFIQQLEQNSYDARLNLLMPGGVDTRVVIVDIDEKSLSEQGRWPWGRDKLANLVNQLFEHYHINTLGFDMVFAERDDSSGLSVLSNLQQSYFQDNVTFKQILADIEPLLNYDQRFADSLQGKKIVLGYYFSNHALEQSGELPKANFHQSALMYKPANAHHFVGYGANLGLLQQQVMASGHFNPVVDSDGLSRRIGMLVEFQGAYYESLSLAVARLALGGMPIELGFAKRGVSKRYSGLEWLSVGLHRVPVDSELSALIPYRGPQGSFKYVSASDVLNGKVSLPTLQDKIVLVGTTAAGLMDLRATPVQNIYAGVEVHANMIAGILDGNIKHQPAYIQGVEFVLLLSIGVLWVLMLPALNPVKSSLLTLALLISLVSINLLVWQLAHLVLPLVSSVLLVVMLFIANMSYGFFVESRAKRNLTKLFGQYMHPQLVSEMADSGEPLNLVGESREMTVLFSDVRGFTTIAESMPPQDLTQLMNHFLSAMTQAIQHHRGTIDKYMGDAVMAFWGAPMHDQQHARHAIAAAFEMQASLAQLNQTFKQKGWPELEIGIGISSGLMTVGNMGSDFRMAYTVMGDAVNLGARLESLTKTFGVPMIVSEATKLSAPAYLYQELDTLRVKGKDISVTIFAPVCLLNEAAQAIKDELALHHAALHYYHQGNNDLAELQWITLTKRYGHKQCYGYYLSRINKKAS